MLDVVIKNQLTAYLDKLENPIEISVWVDDSAKAKELLNLAEELARISTKISLVFPDKTHARVPSMAIAAQGEAPRVTFAGIPMGHEFTSLVLALLHAGGYPPKVEEQQLQLIRALEGELHFETYISLSCQNCPDVVQALNLMARQNPRITHTMIDGALFNEEVEQRQIMSVPTVMLNGKVFGQGRMTLKEILNKVDDKASEREAVTLNAKSPFDVLVVGGGPAGASAAIYAARKGIRTGVVSERFGGQVMDTLGIENFISVEYTEGPKLVASLEQHVKSYDVDIMDNQRAKTLRMNKFIEVELENGATLQTKALILATGARWREMNVPGEQAYRGKGVAYCPHCDGPLFKGKKVAVIGGGNSGIEAAIDLAGIVEQVTVLEFAGSLKADAVLVKKARSMANIDIITNAQTTEVEGDGEKVVGLRYKNRVSGEQHSLKLAGIFVQIGLIPNTDWLKESLPLTRFGEIDVNAKGETALPGVFAAGDVTNVPYKQIIIAMGQGSTASLSAFEYLIRSSVEEDEEGDESAA